MRLRVGFVQSREGDKSRELAGVCRAEVSLLLDSRGRLEERGVMEKGERNSREIAGERKKRRHVTLVFHFYFYLFNFVFIFFVSFPHV